MFSLFYGPTTISLTWWTVVCKVMYLLFNILPRFVTAFLSRNSSVQFSRLVVSESLRPHEPQHVRPPCPSPTPEVHSNPFPLSRWCHPTISSSVIPFSSWLQSFPASGSFPMSQFFASGGQSIGVSALASVLPMNTQDWSPLGWRAHIRSTQSKTGPLVVGPSGLCFNKHCRWFWCSQEKKKIENYWASR